MLDSGRYIPKMTDVLGGGPIKKVYRIERFQSRGVATDRTDRWQPAWLRARRPLPFFFSKDAHFPGLGHDECLGPVLLNLCMVSYSQLLSL